MATVFGPLIGSIDEGTSSARFVLFKAETAEIVCYHQKELSQTTPREGWVEQDPMEILQVVEECIEKTVEKLIALGGKSEDIVAVGVANQRETTIVWNSQTGKPLHNAILWLDVRTSATVDALLKHIPNQNKTYFQTVCGLPLSTYFSGVKLRWLMDNVPAVVNAIDEDVCLFGTVDTWLLWNLTGGPNGGIHITDVTNASRTMLMNIKSRLWDADMCQFFDIPPTVLPEIRSSSEQYGVFAHGPLQGIPLSGCLGDQQAALVGQQCLDTGEAKATYGTGCFLLCNTGTTSVISVSGLLTTVAYQFGMDSEPVYALEGSVAIAGAAIRWLRDNLDMIQNMKDIDNIVSTVEDCGDVYFVPAFSGLYAPYWKQEARGVICGLTEDTRRGHILRATLEAVCYQVRDILEAMKKDSGLPLVQLQVDGGMTANSLLLQLQSDLTGLTVLRPAMAELTALGAAMAAGRAVGKWDLSKKITIDETTFTPNITSTERDERYEKWKMAVERSLGWDV